MYSNEWFETFAATVPPEIISADLGGITHWLPLDQYPRVLDVGCGIGRIAGPLASRGYAVTAIDINPDALRIAQRQAGGPRYLALDQCHVDGMRWVFDGALVLWNSLGFVGRSADAEMLRGLAAVIRPGGRVILDLYHPDWLARNEKAGEPDLRGAFVRRWVRNGRCFHEIGYASGRVDPIQFEIYQPEEIREVCCTAGLHADADMVFWNRDSRPSGDAPRYQIVCSRASNATRLRP